ILEIVEQPTAGPDQTVNCYERDQAQLQGTGTGVWTLDGTSSGTVNIANASSQDPVISGFSAPGTYIFVYSNGFCEDRIVLTVNDNCDCPAGENILAPLADNTACGTF